MFTQPILFNEFLIHSELIDDVYKAMLNPDMSVVVLTLLDIVKKIDALPNTIIKEAKSESKSTAFRNEGNRAYVRSKYQTALICYNKALSYAPKDSRALKLAYSNRSALLHKVKAFKACLIDISTCFSLGCPLDIVEKLRVRKEDARNNVFAEKLAENSIRNLFSEGYFLLNERRNPQIPCASMDVGVIIENEVPKIVSTTDIKVGAVIAVETAFVSQSDGLSSRFSCYYCHKMHLNLEPCEGCCVAMFCDAICREKCTREYHSIECQIMEALDEATSNTWIRVSVKALLKMKQMSSSWTEFIAASRNMGLSRIKISSINEIYDLNYKFSLLNVQDKRHFLHGPMYNSSIQCACIVHYLDKVSGFYPKLPEERNDARCAVARMLMFLSLYAINSQMIQSTTVKERDITEQYETPNFGLFSFLGKLRSSCNGNVLVVGLNNKIGLVAQQPINRGSELIVCYV